MMVPTRGAIAAALLLAAACGGKTDVAGAGGTGSGGTSSGGTSSGGTSSGGTSSGGTSSGGSAGGPSIDELIVSVCQDAQTLSCFPPDCESELYESWKRAFSSGCEALFEDALECVDVHPLTCDAAGEVRIAPECAPIIDKLESCVGNTGACSGGGGSGSCAISCEGPPAWGVQCSEQNGMLSCVCTDGASSGVSFELTGSCSMTDLSSLKDWCT